MNAEEAILHLPLATKPGAAAFDGMLDGTNSLSASSGFVRNATAPCSSPGP